MGFAVVADEVRRLAQRSAQAAKDSASLVDESIAKSQEGAEKVDQVAKVMVAITESATEVEKLVQGVNSSSQEQARGIEQISQAIAQIDGVTQRNAATADESATAGAELAAQTEALDEIVRQMRTLVGE